MVRNIESNHSRFGNPSRVWINGSWYKERSIVIDPRIAFGRPVVLRSGVSTFVIAERIDAGETVRDIAADYDLDSSEIEQAALYEWAA
jgi:uncharacterized protein (DUF433 family)